MSFQLIQPDKVVTEVKYNGVNIPLQQVFEVSNETEMNSLLTTQNIGNAYKYVGTTGNYINGDIYIVKEV